MFKRKKEEVKNNLDFLVSTSVVNSKVLLLNQVNKKVGFFTFQEVLVLSKEKKMDLLRVSKQVSFDVVRFCIKEKLLYQLQKKKKNFKKQKEVKFFYLSPVISENDLEHKIKRIVKLLKKNFPIQIKLKTFGKYYFYINNGVLNLKSIMKKMLEYGRIESVFDFKKKRFFVNIFPLKKKEIKKNSDE